MIKTIAVLVVLVAALVVFRPQIREATYEFSMNRHLQALDLTSEQETRLRALIDRVGNGYAAQVFTDQERTTLQALSREIETGHESAWPTQRVQSLAGRFEAILQRHDL
ncbi:MAG: hypothetical protein AAGC60_28090 [Acidobacteriota bacterium]